jgi:hypothetical protein
MEVTKLESNLAIGEINDQFPVIISSYRLGDLVFLDCLTYDEKNEIMIDHPQSIGAQYICDWEMWLLEMRIMKKKNGLLI